MRHLLVAFGILYTRLASADRPTGLCVDVSAQFTPADQLQIVAWVEDSAGHFIDTIYITSKVGRYGIGNRPGRFDFNSSSPLTDSWPYGRRIQESELLRAAARAGLQPLVRFATSVGNPTP